MDKLQDKCIISQQPFLLLFQSKNFSTTKTSIKLLFQQKPFTFKKSISMVTKRTQKNFSTQRRKHQNFLCTKKRTQKKLLTTLYNHKDYMSEDMNRNTEVKTKAYGLQTVKEFKVVNRSTRQLLM